MSTQLSLKANNFLKPLSSLTPNRSRSLCCCPQFSLLIDEDDIDGDEELFDGVGDGIACVVAAVDDCDDDDTDATEDTLMDDLWIVLCCVVSIERLFDNKIVSSLIIDEKLESKNSLKNYY
jgi:hypothetical protein